MKFLFISILLGGFSFSTIKAEDISKKVESLKIEVNSLKTQQEHLCNDFNALLLKNAKTERQMSEVLSANKKLASNIDSLQDEYNIVVTNQKTISRSLSIVLIKRTN